MQATVLSKDFTKGSIPKALFYFMLPFMASNALQVLYSTVDMIIVGHFVGTPGLSAVSQSSLIVNFVTMVCMGFSNAGQVLISQAIGAGKRKELNGIIGTLFSIVTGISLVLSLVIVFARPVIFHWMNIPVESYDMATDYLVICGLGLVLTAGYNMVSAVLRGMGDSKRPFMFIGIASAINLVLDIIFTGLWGWGVAGAAYATIIGQGVSFVFSLFYLYKKKESFGFDFHKKSFRVDKKYAGMIVSLGMPMAIQSGCINISMLFVNSMVNAIDVVASASFGVGIRIDDIFNKVSQGIQFAVMPMISQNIGAKENKRAKQVVLWSWLFSGLFTVMIFAVYLVWGKELFMLFSDDVLVHGMADTFVAAILWMFPALAIMRGTSAFIQGIGNAKLGMVLSILDGVVLRIGFSWLFGIFLEWGCAIPGMVYFLSGKWEKRRVLAEKI